MPEVSKTVLVLGTLTIVATLAGCSSEGTAIGSVTPRPSPPPPTPTAAPDSSPSPSPVSLLQPPAVVTDRARSNLFAFERNDTSPSTGGEARSSQYVLILDGGL